MTTHEAKKLMADKLIEAGLSHKLSAKTIRSPFTGIPRIYVTIKEWDFKVDTLPFQQFAKDNGFVASFDSSQGFVEVADSSSLFTRYYSTAKFDEMEKATN